MGMKSTGRLLILLTSILASVVLAQIDTTEWTTQDDHQNMQQQLGITALRPGPSGMAGPDEPGAANVYEDRANPYPDWPQLLVMDNGEPVTSAMQWMTERRAEVVEHFEREVTGRVPENVPDVMWEVVEVTPDTAELGGIPVTGQRLIGHVDNSAYPDLTVEIQMLLVVPADAPGPVPVLMMFGGGALPGTEDANARPRFGGPAAGPSSQEMLIAAGWGYATVNPGSIQADNGAGLTKGIIGLVNKGQPRSPEDWGSLRAWAWGAARGLDYLETVPYVDAGNVGIEGVSRYGKAALVTHAFEPRFKMVLVGSSGEGGASPYRRNFGEAVENITGSGEYHWMAGNFLKYGTAESSFGEMDADNLPIDSHMLIALSAPRPSFISYGIPENGDALWLDQQGSYMATVAAGEVYRLLGVKDIGDTNDYKDALKPPVNLGLTRGTLAWRQHDGGHEDRSNMQYFIEWANEQIGYESP